jgi:hypothetical protein
MDRKRRNLLATSSEKYASLAEHESRLKQMCARQRERERERERGEGEGGGREEEICVLKDA